MKKFSFMLIAFMMFILSCKKDGTNPSNQEISLQPFFMVEKGDSISKDVYREKPEFDKDVTLLYSSENDKSSHLKSATQYITDLYILTSDHSTATPP